MTRFAIPDGVQRGTFVATFIVLAVILFARSARADGVMYVAHDSAAARRIFPLTRTEVKTDIAGDVISTTVTQKFQNPYAERIEAVYVFPLPNRAAVDDMEMHLGARTVRAEVRRRVEAQAAYDAATRRGQHAALLEQERPNVFTFSVANIEPGGEIEVRIHYFEIAKYDHGTYEMVFPMVVGPRYIPGLPLAGASSGTGTKRDTDRVPDASRISPAYVPPGTRSGHGIALTVHLDAGTALESVESPNHDVTAARPSASVADVTPKSDAEIANRDFILRWRLAAPELKTAIFPHRPVSQAPGGEDGYLALLMEPKHDPNATEISPRELFFLLDTSGSMKGAPLATAALAVRRALETMNPSDTFQIIDFADAASSFATAPLPNTSDNVRRASEYLDHLQGSGGTNQLVGIHAALAAKGDPARVRFIVFMTDGYIGNDASVIQLVRDEIGHARIFGFGVGSSVNRHVLDEVSLAGRGAGEYLGSARGAQAETKDLVDRFFERIGRPYLTDIEIDWGSLGVSDTYPQQVPDLSAFQPLLVLARFHGAGKGIVTVRGKIGGRPFEQKITVSLPEASNDNAALSRIWAREKIAHLTRLERLRGGQEPEITRVALAHHLVSQYTSLVAVDQSPGQASTQSFPMLVHQPTESPEGVNLDSAGGQVADLGRVPPTSVQGESVSKRGGCAGCNVGSPRDLGGDVAVFALALLFMIRRKKRGSA